LGDTFTIEVVVILDKSYVNKLLATGITEADLVDIMMIKWNGVCLI